MERRSVMMVMICLTAKTQRRYGLKIVNYCISRAIASLRLNIFIKLKLLPVVNPQLNSSTNDERIATQR
jgi:hypothetical protein